MKCTKERTGFLIMDPIKELLRQGKTPQEILDDALEKQKEINAELKQEEEKNKVRDKFLDAFSDYLEVMVGQPLSEKSRKSMEDDLKTVENISTKRAVVNKSKEKISDADILSNFLESIL